MKKLASLLVMAIFLAGFAFAQTPPAKKTEKKEVKTEMKTEKKAEKKEAKSDTSKKAVEHKQHMNKKK
jgi:Ni/Co efflux regulator RcnB